ncbi:hypothetical protein BH11BAC4_BH11BAC4_18710 [soil metagenome]
MLVEIGNMSDQLNHNQPRVRYEITRIKPYTLKELAGLYDVDTRTLRKWLDPFKKRIGVKRGRIYTAVQVERILNFIGPIKDIINE